MAPCARPKGENAAAKPARVERQVPHRSAKFSGDLQMRPRRAGDEEQGRDEGSERRYNKRPEGRFDKDARPQRPRPEGNRSEEGHPERREQREDGRKERRPGKRERAELRDAEGRTVEHGKGGFEGRKTGKPGGPRGEGRFGASDRDTRSGPRSGGPGNKSRRFDDGPKDGPRRGPGNKPGGKLWKAGWRQVRRWQNWRRWCGSSAVDCAGVRS